MSNIQTLNVLNQSIDLIERYTNCVLKDIKQENEKTRLENLAPYILHFSNAIETSKIREQIFEDFVAKIDSVPEDTNWDHLFKEFAAQVDAVKEPIKNPEKCKKYKDYLSLLSSKTLKDDEGIETVYQTECNIDPISKLPIVEPVKNKKCGHVYDKTTILKFLSVHPGTKCPIPGCSATGFIKKSDLIPEQVVKRTFPNILNENPSKKVKTDD